MVQIIDETAGLNQKFPDRGRDLRQLYMASEKFRELVRDFNDATEALTFWSTERNRGRQREYQAILGELEGAVREALLHLSQEDGNSPKE